MSSRKEVKYLTTAIANATELETMVFDKIVDTPGIAAEIQGTKPRNTDFNDADLGVLQMQLSNERDSDEDELPLVNPSEARERTNSKRTQEQREQDKRDEEEMDIIFDEIVEKAEEEERQKKEEIEKQQKQQKQQNEHLQQMEIAAKAKQREALKVKTAIMNNQMTPTPDPSQITPAPYRRDREESTGSTDLDERVDTPPTSDPNPRMTNTLHSASTYNPRMTNTLNSASTFLNTRRNTDGEEVQRRDTRVSTILSEDGTFDENQKVFTKGEIKFIKNVLKCCVAENGFDLYQLMAFDGASGTKDGCWSYIKYTTNIIKAILCALTQVFGIIIIMIDFVTTGLEEKGVEFGQFLCRPPDYNDEWYLIIYNSNLKILAFLFSSFLAYFSIDALMGVEQGMYKKMKYASTIKWVNVIWLRIGFSVNVFVSIIAVYGSFVVIFFSDDSLDMVLNSVALFFIVELDDILVKQNDYERIHDHVMEYAHPSKNKTEKKKCCAGCRKCVGCCCSKITKCIAWLYTLPFTILRYFTIAACVFMPIYVGYCY